MKATWLGIGSMVIAFAGLIVAVASWASIGRFARRGPPLDRRIQESAIAA
ncbi:hypothetical protein AB0J20_24455 [Micromonospora costi]